MQQALTPLRVHAALAREILDRIAGDEMDQREREQRHAEERRNDQRDAAEDVGQHETWYARAFNVTSGGRAQARRRRPGSNPPQWNPHPATAGLDRGTKDAGFPLLQRE